MDKMDVKQKAKVRDEFYAKAENIVISEEMNFKYIGQSDAGAIFESEAGDVAVVKVVLKKADADATEIVEAYEFDQERKRKDRAEKAAKKAAKLKAQAEKAKEKAKG